MTKISYQIGVFGVLLGTAIATVGWTRQPTVLLPGSEPFTVRRLDWFAVDMNATTRMDKMDEPNNRGYFVTFVPIFKDDTLLIYSRYRPGTPKSDVDRAIRVAHEALNTEAKTYGFQDWLKVKEDVAPFPPAGGE